MKYKLMKLLKSLLLGLIGVILINICTVFSYAGISGLLQKLGTNLQNIMFLKTSIIIIASSSLLYTLLYIILCELKNKKIYAPIMILSGIMFAISLGKCYGSYFSDLFSSVLNMNPEAPGITDVLIKIGKYAFVGVTNLCIFIYAYAYKLLRDFLTKVEKDNK